jgi:hypothetical protein
MGLAVAMALILLGFAIMMAAIYGIVWSIAHTVHAIFVTARVVVRRGRT